MLLTHHAVSRFRRQSFRRQPFRRQPFRRLPFRPKQSEPYCPGTISPAKKVRLKTMLKMVCSKRRLFCLS